MSRWNSKAEAIRDHLAALPCIRSMDISVHRTDNLLAQVNAAFEKAAGTGCVIVKWLGGKNPDPKSSALRMGGRFSISLWTRQVLADEDSPADDLIEEIASHLHGWVDPRPGAFIHRMEVEEVSLVPDAPGYLVHEITANITRI